MHGGPDHAIKWHANAEDHLEDDMSKAVRFEKYAGKQMRQILSGEGYAVENRDVYRPFQPQSKYESDCYWRGQQVHESGRTLVQRTVEHAFFPDRKSSLVTHCRRKTHLDRNISQLHETSQKNRETKLRSRPLTDDDLLNVTYFLRR